MEIIEKAVEQSDGDWVPSPGLIYPLLGRLVRDGLIEEGAGRSYSITAKGRKAMYQYGSLQSQIDRQLQLLTKLGVSIFSSGRLVAEETFERLVDFTSVTTDQISTKSLETQRRFDERYREFLLSELERLERKTDSSSGKSV